MYLNGGKNIAEAIRYSHNDPNIAQPSRMSIAMRMKQNRDALMGNSNQDAMSEKSKYSSIQNQKDSDYSHDHISPKSGDRIKMINNMNNKNAQVGQGIQSTHEKKHMKAQELRDSR
jgi:hypothetical protein